MPEADINALNQRELRKLELSVETQPQRLNLLLAVCDDRNLQAQLIEQYEAELRDAGIATYRTRLSHQRPSLKAALLELAEQEPALQTGDPAVVTVLNAGELLGVRLTAEKSEQEKFFFSLQWTRESLRQFNFPIVLWLPDDVATRLAQQAPDFWSWRNGVFEFAADPPDLLAARPDDLQPMPMMEFDETRDANSHIPTANLEKQISTLTDTSPDSPLLITLHNALGEAYKYEYRYQDALVHYEQALTHAQAHENVEEQARSLCNLGDALKACGRLSQAVPYYQQALNLYKALDDVVGKVAILNRLGIIYDALGQYQIAVDFHQQALEIARNIGDRLGEVVSLSNLGNAYASLRQYQQAISFHQEALEMARQMNNRRGEASSLGNLGIIYGQLSQYQQAVDFLQTSLEISHEIGDHQSEAASLGNLGSAYSALGQYQQATNFQKRYLRMARDMNDYRGEANSLFNTALNLERLNEVSEAQSHYEAAKAIFSDLGLQGLVERCEEAMQLIEERLVDKTQQDEL